MVFLAAFALLRVFAATALHREGAKKRKGIGQRAAIPVSGYRMRSKEELERVGALLVDAAFTVHSALGPGLLESAYQVCLVHELQQRRLSVRREVSFLVFYAGLTVDTGYRVDMVIEEEILLENKAVQLIVPIHRAQLLTYLKLSNKRLGYLINWNVPRIKDGIRRIVNNL